MCAQSSSRIHVLTNIDFEICIRLKYSIKKKIKQTQWGSLTHKNKYKYYIDEKKKSTAQEIKCCRDSKRPRKIKMK